MNTLFLFKIHPDVLMGLSGVGGSPRLLPKARREPLVGSVEQGSAASLWPLLLLEHLMAHLVTTGQLLQGQKVGE